jgi:exodeoxyribonuclease V gamma subunit
LLFLLDAGKVNPLFPARLARTPPGRKAEPMVNPDTPDGAGLHLFTSNRLETLAAKLAGRLRRPLPSPLQPEIVVVRNKGMERWLKLELARQHGICANCEFPFPEAFGRRVFRELAPDLQEQSPLERDVLCWRVARALPELLERAEFKPLRQYLAGAEDQRKFIQISGKIAYLFDQYLIFRPQMIIEWDSGHGDDWQAVLWRAVSADCKEHHAAALWKRFGQAANASNLSRESERRAPTRHSQMRSDIHAGSETGAPPAFEGTIREYASMNALPERLSIFGVSALPPFYLDLFAGLARRHHVNLFLLQPSQEYWGDITSPREGERILARQLGSDAEAFQLHLETGNRLLASMGYLGRDFLKLLLGAGDWVTDESFTEPDEDTLLHCIQSDILHLRDRGRPESPGAEEMMDSPSPSGRGSDAARAAAYVGDGKSEARQTVLPFLEESAGVRADQTTRKALSPNDDSIQIHSCHSPLREMEVLHDQMLDWFQRDPALAPRDIVVMTPDIEAYAPFIQAVFGSPEDESRAIPFGVADRGARRQSQIIATFLQLLGLPDTRFGAAKVLVLLETPAVRERFGLSEADLEAIRSWVEETNIRWGIDAAHRGQLGLPKLPGNTWRDGLDRLLLGYAMAGRDGRLFQGILPFDDLEGTSATVLGHFTEFVECLVTLMETLGQPRRLDEWAATFREVTDQFFQSSEESALELQTLRDALATLRRHHALSGFGQAISLAAVLERLAPALEEDLQHSGFLTGGVTFCGLKPMRSIPFKIVCLVGMNDGAFPRPTQHLSFDLMAKAPRLGDRSTREDDRYLFLETLLSARQRLYLSHVGQNIRDNSEAPPSVLVSELLDYIEQGFALADARPIDQPEENVQRSTLNVESSTAFQGGKARMTPLRAHLFIHHRLQAFSEEYFKPGSRLFSYSRENCRASNSVRQARTNPPPFLTRPLTRPEPELLNVTLDDLTAFFANPSKFLLNRRLKIFLPGEGAGLDEREPFVLDALEGYQLKQDLLGRALAGQSLVESRLAATGQLPLGAVGRAEYGRTATRVESFVERLRAKLPTQAIAPLDLDLVLGEFHVTGRVAGRNAAGPLLYRCARLKPKDVLRAWLLHLAVNATDTGCVAATTLIGEDGLREYGPLPGARTALKDLLDLYWQGMSSPLKFFPNASLAFAEAEFKSRRRKPSRTARPPLEKARVEWEGSDFPKRDGEREDAHFALCFRDADPLDEEFVTLARRVFGPILQHERREEA